MRTRHHLSPRPLLALLLLLGCGGTPRVETHASDNTASGGSATTQEVSAESGSESGTARDDRGEDAIATSADAPETPTPCPESFATAHGHCASGSPECTYPEGRCYCGERPVCSGMMRQPNPPGYVPNYSWVCAANPPDVREDGCPGVQPEVGTRCAVNHPCGYGFCGGPIFGCEDHRWRMTGFSPPPP